MTNDTEITDLAEQIALRIEGIMLPDRWLKIQRAIKYSGIGRDRLKKLADCGEIRGFPDPDSGRGDWIFDRYLSDDSIGAHELWLIGETVDSTAKIFNNYPNIKLFSPDS